MPVSRPASRFVPCLHDLHLLKPAQIAELRDCLGGRFDDAQALGQELLRRGWLTAYQVDELRRGRSPVLGPYLLLERLGEGGMGQVYKARHRLMNRLVALKLIRRDRLAGNGPARFLREMQTAARLDHPHIVHAYDADKVKGRPLLVMEYVEGGSLGGLVDRVGPLPVGAACEYVRQAALGLHHAHERGVIHRDVKPSNLLLKAAEGQVKVADFGLSRLREAADDGLTHTGWAVGTADYIAPEQATDSRSVDLRADLYGLGCTLYCLLSGGPPFPEGSLVDKLRRHACDDPRPVEALRPDVPAALAAVVARLMAKKPQDRYPTAAEVAGALGALLDGGAAAIAPGDRPGGARLATKTMPAI
jgi:serine/threonine-protein kinase